MKKQDQNDEKKPSIIKRLKQRKEQKEIEEFKNKTELERVEERREEVLSKGRKFKYPLQYAKYRIVTVTCDLFGGSNVVWWILVLISIYVAEYRFSTL